MKGLLRMLAGMMGLAGCSLNPRPGTALHQLKFAVPPQIVQRGDQYYLRYQVDVPPDVHPSLRVLFTKKTAEKAYYYFSVPTSHREFGSLVERPLDEDGFAEYARRSAVYWLDPDGKETAVPIVRAPEGR